MKSKRGARRKFVNVQRKRGEKMRSYERAAKSRGDRKGKSGSIGRRPATPEKQKSKLKTASGMHALFGAALAVAYIRGLNPALPKSLRLSEAELRKLFSAFVALGAGKKRSTRSPHFRKVLPPTFSSGAGTEKMRGGSAPASMNRSKRRGGLKASA